MKPEIPYDLLDDGIREAVRLLAEGGLETLESCQGALVTLTQSLRCVFTGNAMPDGKHYRSRRLSGLGY